MGQTHRNVLTIEGVSVETLQQTYGTPLYIMNETEVAGRFRTVRDSFLNRYERTYALYASKALSIKAVYDLAMHHGLSVDVVSRGEMYVALHAGVPAERIHVHGSNKTEADIEFALTHGIDQFTIDNMEEIELLNELASRHGVSVRVLLRIVPQVIGGAHSSIQTGGVDTKFGFPTHDETYLEAVRRTLASPQLTLRGIHCHVGSQIQEAELFETTAATMMSFVDRIRRQTGFVTEVLNIGGGFGIAYRDGDVSLHFEETMDRVMNRIEHESLIRGLVRPIVGIEPGRWLVASAGSTLYEVGTIKRVSGIRTYVSVDGGMTDNIRPALYGADYEIIAATKPDEPCSEVVKVVGSCCESGDVIAHEAHVPPLERGDLLLVKATGAYNFSMASNYNQMLRPAVVFVRDGKHRLVVRRQTFADLVACEMEGTPVEPSR